jgi:LuxR family maltose regulon positive regulatory protein
MTHIHIGEVLYERNDLDGAVQALTYGVELLRGSIEQTLLAQGYVVLGRIQQAHGDLEGAFATIQRGEDWFVQMQMQGTGTGARAFLALGKVRLWLRQGQVAAANRWAETCQWSDEETKPGYLQRLTLVRLQLARSRYDPKGPFLAEASELLGQLLARAEASGWFGHLIEILILQALVYQAQGDFGRALTALERVLTLAEPEGYVRSFVNEGEPMAELLTRWKTVLLSTRGSDRLKDYVRKLLSVLEEEEDKAPEAAPLPLVRPSTLKAQPLVDPLSLREQELLRLVAAGYTNQEIAQELFLAVGTVKKHLNNIFGKLRVGNRTQAIARARELGIVD